jgi:hypothetical protein
MNEEPYLAAHPEETQLLTCVMTTGRERTRTEWESLLSRAGFRMTRIVPMAASAIIEAELA